MQPLSRITGATVDVLTALLDQDATWGLQVVKRSSRPPGTVYPLLDRLERSGWVESHWEVDEDRSGPRRRLYTLTADGASAARATVTAFRATRSPAGTVQAPA
jgi:PadR family transcriptional regulator PadR